MSAELSQTAVTAMQLIKWVIKSVSGMQQTEEGVVRLEPYLVSAAQCVCVCVCVWEEPAFSLKILTVTLYFYSNYWAGSLPPGSAGWLWALNACPSIFCSSAPAAARALRNKASLMRG